MAESNAHMTFVRRIVSYVDHKVPDVDRVLIVADLPEYAERPPRVLNGFCPDVYHKNSKCILIGEAKTDNDIENAHTEAQLDSYIQEVRCYSVKRHIVLCSSVKSFPLLKNKIIKMKQTDCLDDITFHVLDPLQKEFII